MAVLKLWLKLFSHSERMKATVLAQMLSEWPQKPEEKDAIYDPDVAGPQTCWQRAQLSPSIPDCMARLPLDDFKNSCSVDLCMCGISRCSSIRWHYDSLQKSFSRKSEAHNLAQVRHKSLLALRERNCKSRRVLHRRVARFLKILWTFQLKLLEIACRWSWVYRLSEGNGLMR